MVKQVDVAIIGAGPAGATAGIYTARANLKPVVFTGLTSPGGALVNTTDIENFPGFKDGISGAELVETIKQQSERFGAKYVMDEIEAVDFSGTTKILHTQLGEEYHARAVILAPGSKYRHLGCIGEKEFAGRGVSYCATCDGYFFKGKDLVVVGGGDTAMEEAIYLAHMAASVTVIHRRENFRASKIMLDRVQKNTNIKLLTSQVVHEICGDNLGVQAVVLKNTETGALQEFKTGGVFVAVGSIPTTGIFAEHVQVDESGYIQVFNNSSATSLPGVFAAGDAIDPQYRQAIVASGAGAKAAIDAERYLEGLEV
ncbi:MAG: thioredoxin-disulfide reductase [Candidatus Ancillula sp.]|jgi:thioredoxin reductase (NADPH)|nr:thioredoxin-disulfide reductase [Candidatus Ancillula sp.]